MTIVGSMRKLYENREGGNKFNSKFTLNFVYLHKIMNMEFLLFFFFLTNCHNRIHISNEIEFASSIEN